MLKYVFTYGDSSIILKGSDSPANVDGFTLSLSRHEIYHSVLLSYTISEKLQGEGKKWIDNLISLHGWNLEIQADVSMFDGVQYLPLIEKGRVNLRKCVQSELYTEINLENGSFESNILNRDDNEINLISDVDINGKDISSFLTPASDVYLRGTTETSKQIKGYLLKDAFQKSLRVITGEAYPIDEDASPVIFNDNRITTLGQMIRGFENVDFPIKFIDLFKSISIQSGYGMGFKRGLDTKVYFDYIDAFYPQTITAEITDIRNLEYSFDEDLIFNKLEVGYANYEKKENTNGQSEFNNKAYYTVPINHFDKTKQLISPYRADGLSIERLKNLGISDASDNMDNEVFIFDCIIKDGVLTNRKNELFDTISGIYSSLELYTNLLFSPARIINAWSSFISIPFIWDTTKNLLFQKSETQTKLSTRYQNEPLETSDGVDIPATNLSEPFLTGRIIKFDCTFTAQILQDIINSPNGLHKFNDYINKISNFGYIKNINLVPVDKSHMVELYEARNVPDIEAIGYLLKEDGSPLLLENGSLIQLEYNMPQIPTKISALPQKFTFDDDDDIVIANNGYNYRTKGSVIKASIAAETEAIETYSIDADFEKIINLGAYDLYKTFYINYTLTRGARFRAGLFIIKAYSDSQASISDPSPVIIPEIFGETGGLSNISADVNSNQVRLKLTTDNLDAEITDLFIKVTKMA